VQSDRTTLGDVHRYWIYVSQQLEAALLNDSSEQLDCELARETL
jgi:hypothetical protein